MMSKLYKQTTTGAIQTWEVKVEGNVITNTYGQLDGKLQTAVDVIKEGKNKGKVNETTPEEQALIKAQQMYDKKLKSGYTPDLNLAKRSNNVLDGVKPMLAYPIEDKEKYVKFPCICQPKFDGCLHGKSKIITNLGVKTISEIVDNKIKCNVLSYNESNNTVEYKPIINWFNNGKADFNKWMYIKLSKTHVIKCTENHKIFTNNGWKRADELDSNTDKILANRGNKRLFSLITGTLLGDACVKLEKRNENSTSYRILFSHTNEELIKYKVSILNIGNKITQYKSGYGSNGFRFCSNALTKTDYPINEIIHIDGENKGQRKTISSNFLLKTLCNEGLAMWIADDGSLSFNNGNKLTPILTLHTQGFTDEQINEFIIFFKKKYNCEPNVYKDRKVENGSGKFLSFNTKDTLFILNQLREYQIKGVEYKFYFKTENYLTKIEPIFDFYNFKVCRSGRNVPQTKYDIEVADNHNYFANDILVHNCRAIIVKKGGEVTLYSRTQKVISTLPHINAEILRLFKDIDITMDGELYNHEFHDDFNQIISMIKRDEVHPLSAKFIQFYWYDTVAEGSWYKRNDFKFDNTMSTIIKEVPTYTITSKKDMYDLQVKLIEAGYEGLMYRSIDGLYEHKRSSGLLKVKTFKDAEFEIIGVEEGNGKLMGKAGSFICKTTEGKTFNVKMTGSLDSLTDYLHNFDKYKGKMLTVKYQELTPDEKIPRFPVGKCIRLEE